MGFCQKNHRGEDEFIHSCALLSVSSVDKRSSLVRGADVDQRGQQQKLWWLVQQDQIITPQTVIVHPAPI